MKNLLTRFLLSGFVALLLAAPVFAQDDDQETKGTGPNYEVRLQADEDQLHSLQGRIEQLENSTRQLNQTLQRLQADIDARLTKLEASAAQSAPPPAQTAAQAPAAPAPAKTAPPAPATNFTAAQPDTGTTTNPSVANGTLGDLKMQNGKIVGAVDNPQAPPLPQTPPDYGLTPQEQYDRAFDLLRQANYEDAETAFKNFIDKNPKDKLIDNAKYWYGETLYVRGKFAEAAVAFADAYQQNTQGAKAPDCLLKLAMSLGALQKTSDACATLGELKTKYPKAPITVRSRADQERSHLKCPAPAAASE